MTRAQLAKNLRQIVPLFWVLGALVTIAYLDAVLRAAMPAGERPVDSEAVFVLIGQLLVVWIGLAWMALVAYALAELLAPPPA